MKPSDFLIIVLTIGLLSVACVNTKNNAEALEIAKETKKLLRKEDSYDE